MIKLELENIGHDFMHTKYRYSKSNLEFYDWLKIQWPKLIKVTHEPKNDFEDPEDNGLPWAYCYFEDDYTDADHTWYMLKGGL